jgi:hypothetical protein
MTYTAHTHSDLYKAGVTEDGEDYTAEVYLVFLENGAGRRFCHNSYFMGCNAVYHADEGFYSFEDIRVQAKAKADRLTARVNAAGGKVDLAHWAEIDPYYGSKEYVLQGTEAQRAALDRHAA